MARLNVPTIFVVSSLDLLEQSYDVFCETLRIPIGKIGGGECKIEKFNVCTIQTLFSAFNLKYEPLEKDGFVKEKIKITERNDEIKKLISNDIGMIIVDEVQHLKSDMYIKLMTLSKNVYNIFGLSATPYRYDSTDIILNAYAGKTIVNITASYLIDRKYLVPPTIFMLDPNEHTKYKFLSQSFPTVYNKWIVENKDRNNLIVDCCKRLLDLNRTTLITVSRIKHGEIILEEIEKQIPGVKVDFIRGEVDKKTRKELLEKVRLKELKILVGTSVADEGLDLPALDAAILAGGGISLIKSLQRIGRTLRPYPGKTNAIIVDFYDRLRYLVGQSRKRQKIYSQAPRFEIQKHF
jgi:superfamily II DNA or RNA helicase